MRIFLKVSFSISLNFYCVQFEEGIALFSPLYNHPQLCINIIGGGLMFFKKSWFYIITYGIIFIMFMFLNSFIIRQPKPSWYSFLISMSLMILSSVIAIILSFKETKTNNGKQKILSLVCLIFSICLVSFASVWLMIILSIEFN